jgi:hypothetical protein
MNSDRQRGDRDPAEATGGPRRRANVGERSDVVADGPTSRDEPDFLALFRRADPTRRAALVERLQRTRGNTATPVLVSSASR